MPKVSIVLPVYNSEKYIDDCIKSVLNQTFKDWELIIVDDCSRDNSLKIINKYKNNKFIIIQNSKNLGAAKSRNIAISKANGRYIAFIDSDDVWKNNKLEKQIKFMEDNNIDFSYSSYERVREDGEIIGKVEAPNMVDFEYILKNVAFQISTVIIDTNKIKKDQMQMPEIKTSEDTAMYLQILNSGIKAYGIKDYLVKYMVRKNSLSSNKVLNCIRLWNTYKKFNINLKNRYVFIFEHIRSALARGEFFSKIKRVKIIFSLLDLLQFFEIILFPFIAILALLLKPVCKNIWIIEENPNEACDNGYIFFKYIRENRKDINAYYIIKRKSKDIKKVEKLGNIIYHKSLKHWIYYMNAKKIIVTQKYANPSIALFYILHKKNILRTPRVFLQHGITKDDCKTFYYNRTKFRLFICGAKKEYEFIKEKFGYPEKNVVLTGFARFDNLDISNRKNNNFILITPTWRNWIKTQNDFDLFMNNYYDIVNDDEFIKYLKEKNMHVQIVLHKNMKKFKIKEEIINNSVKINHNNEVDIQELLNKADLLVTDYSSIFMDIAYRKRPIIYYQFDKNKYRKEQLLEGYFIYETDGFGDITQTKDETINKIKYYINNEFEIEEKYLRKMDEFFKIKDKNNCKRILEEIEKI